MTEPLTLAYINATQATRISDDAKGRFHFIDHLGAAILLSKTLSREAKSDLFLQLGIFERNGANFYKTHPEQNVYIRPQRYPDGRINLMVTAL